MKKNGKTVNKGLFSSEKHFACIASYKKQGASSKSTLQKGVICCFLVIFAIPFSITEIITLYEKTTTPYPMADRPNGDSPDGNHPECPSR